MPLAKPAAQLRLLLAPAGKNPGSMPALLKGSIVPAFPLLRRTALPELLDEGQLRELERACRGVGRRAGELVFRQGEHAEAAFLICDGSVELRARPPGRRVYRTIEVVRAPCTVGDETLFQEERYLTTARTLEPVRLLALSRPAFERLSRGHPDIAAALLRVAGGCLVQTVRRCAILTQAPADVGLRLLLTEMAAERTRRDGSPGGVRITHAQLAGVLHLSRETVSRMLRQMEGEGIVELGRGVIHVLS
jgi:CRP/FNR family transcriptional regulator, cyclic AMP receptor protein